MYLSNYNNKARHATRMIQAQMGFTGWQLDGLWGDASQRHLVVTGKKFDFDWEKLKTNFGRFEQSQVDGFNSILDAVNNFHSSKYTSKDIKPAFFAYMLATAWHETGIIVKRNNKKVLLHSMQPVEEMGKGKGRRYGSRIDIHGGRYSSELPIYYGRGYVQLTWLTNYVFMRNRLKVDFVNHPELALDPKHAADIMIVGMMEGSFTSRSLFKYIKFGLYDEFVQARRVINGTDKADLIAKYAVDFLECIVVI